MRSSPTHCPDATATLLGVIDPSVAPPLLFYAYIPIIIVSVGFAAYVLVNDNYSLRSRLLLYMSFVFAGLLMNEIVQWIAVPVRLVAIGWQLVPFFRLLVAGTTTYFAHVFIAEKDFSYRAKLVLTGAYLAVLSGVPTTANIMFFNLDQCEGVPGWLWYVVDAVALAGMLWIAIIGAARYRSCEAGANRKGQILYVSLAAILFLGLFFGASMFGDALKTYGVGLVGPIGMVTFVSVLSYVVVQYKAFHTKVFTAQMLVMAILSLIGALFFMGTSVYAYLVEAVTFGVVAVVGLQLMRSVKKEIEQREQIQRLATDLEAANHQKDTVLHMVAHQLNGPITVIKCSAEMMLDGDTGQLTEEQHDYVLQMRNAGESMKTQSEMVLVAAKITSGRELPLERAPVDLSEFFNRLIQEAELIAKERHVRLRAVIPSELPTVMLDQKFTQWAIGNLISNALKYTALRFPSKGGEVEVAVERKMNTLYCVVRDNGIGIPEEDKGKMFKELSRASNAGKEGTGLGLHIAKGAIEAQGGKIRFESTKDIGTTFYVELPLMITTREHAGGHRDMHAAHS